MQKNAYRIAIVQVLECDANHGFQPVSLPPPIPLPLCTLVYVRVYMCMCVYNATHKYDLFHV
jgi:hypothetical protein